MVKFEKDVEKNTYSWVYTGGCFKNNEPVLYEWADPDVKYNFHDVQFEVRVDHRTLDDLGAPEEEEDTEDAFEDDVDEDEAVPTTKDKTKKEKPQVKIKRERDTLNESRTNGSLKP